MPINRFLVFIENGSTKKIMRILPRYATVKKFLSTETSLILVTNKENSAIDLKSLDYTIQVPQEVKQKWIHENTTYELVGNQQIRI